MINPTVIRTKTRFDDITNCFSWSIIVSHIISNTTTGQDIFWTLVCLDFHANDEPSSLSEHHQSNVAPHRLKRCSRSHHLTDMGHWGIRAIQIRDGSSPILYYFWTKKAWKNVAPMTISVSASFSRSWISRKLGTTQQGLHTCLRFTIRRLWLHSHAQSQDHWYQTHVLGEKKDNDRHIAGLRIVRATSKPSISNWHQSKIIISSFRAKNFKNLPTIKNRQYLT